MSEQASSDGTIKRLSAFSDDHGGVIRLFIAIMTTAAGGIAVATWNQMQSNSLEVRELKGQLAAVAGLGSGVGVLGERLAALELRHGERLRAIEERLAGVEARQKGDAERLDRKRRELDEVQRVIRELLGRTGGPAQRR